MNAQLDKEIEAYQDRYLEVEDEINELDQQLSSYESLICEKDAEIQNLQESLKAVEIKKKQDEEAFKQQLLEEAAKRQQRDWYSPVNGDNLDELFAQHVNACIHSVGI